jgi:Icc-related predicted phosphoesterase
VLAKEITAALRIPAIAVLGNHDLESNQEKELTQILNDAGVVMLDGDSYELHGVGFAGVKGFAGGFGRRALGAWGEKIIKDFVHEAINESLKLEAALARLRTPQKIAVLHYSPIQATVEGEPPEIIAFLGSSRLEEPIDRYRVNAVFHGHAHRGSPEGRTHNAAPVYNVAMPVLAANYPDRLPFRVVEIPVARAAAAV